MLLLTRIRLMLPMILAALALVGSCVPLYISGMPSFVPIVDVMAIYYWTSYRPQALPYWFIFTLGILRDCVEGITFGIGPFVYLLVAIMVSSSRSLYRKENFLVIWQGFAIAALIAILGKWALISFVMDAPVGLNAAIIQFLFSISTYPIFHWFFNLVYVTMPEDLPDA